MSAVLQLLSIAWAVLIGPLSLTLLIVATTWTGRGFAFAGLLAALAPLLGAGWRRMPGKTCLRLAIPMAVIASTILLALAWRAPTGIARSGAQAQHVYRGDIPAFQRWALGNILPEVDQLALGLAIMPLVDSHLTYAQASRAKGPIREIYTELEQDPDFHALGSVLPDAYDETLGMHFDHGHSFLYMPKSLSRVTPAPTLVFLHGSGGNFKAYSWLLARLADRLNLIVLAPSYGMGNWHRSDCASVVDTAVTAAARVVKIDHEKICVVSLSNGGLGATQLVAGNTAKFRSFIFLSPVFDDRRMQGILASRAREVRMLVLTGALDDRVPLEYVEQRANEMKRAGAHVAMDIINDADHFAFFSHRDRVLRSCESWLSQNGIATAPVAH